MGPNKVEILFRTNPGLSAVILIVTDSIFKSGV